MEYKTISRIKAEDKLKELFEKKIISNVYNNGNHYVIEYLSHKEYYKQSVEAQKEMGEKYLNHLIDSLDEE